MFFLTICIKQPLICYEMGQTSRVKNNNKKIINILGKKSAHNFLMSFNQITFFFLKKLVCYFNYKKELSFVIKVSGIFKKIYEKTVSNYIKKLPMNGFFYDFLFRISFKMVIPKL